MSAEKLLAVDFKKENPLELVLPHPPILSSKNLEWDGLVLEYHQQPAWETPDHSFTQHLICICLGQQQLRAERVLNGRRMCDRIHNGDIFVAPATTYHQAIWYEKAEFIVLSLEPTLLRRAVFESVDADCLELLPHFTTPDPLIQQIGLALKAELETGGWSTPLYVDSLVNTLCVHLVRHYSVFRQKTSTYSSGLQHKLKWAVEYIHENLEQDLKLGEIAETVGMSAYHFARAFKQSTGLPPHRYLIQRRLEQAKRLLAETDLAIADIAYRVGFANQSHFTTLFRKHTAITPKAYRNTL